MAKKPESSTQSLTEGILRAPLAPDTLTRLKKLSEFPAEPFDPNGSWTQSYRYEVCGGRMKPQWNPAMGWLRVARSADNDGSTLEIEDHLQFQGSQQHRKATVHYLNEGVARPASWEYELSYFNKDGRERAELHLHQTCVVDRQSIVVTSNGKQSAWSGASDLTCSWGLYDAVQRLPHDASADYRFTLLDGLQTIKANHRLVYAGQSTQPWGDHSVQLHQYRHFGTGIGPTEYWSNEHNQLVLVTSMTLACVYDPDAKQKADHDKNLVIDYEKALS